MVRSDRVGPKPKAAPSITSKEVTSSLDTKANTLRRCTPPHTEAAGCCWSCPCGPAAGAQVVGRRPDLEIRALQDGVEDLQALLHDFLSDSVPWDHCEIKRCHVEDCPLRTHAAPAPSAMWRGTPALRTRPPDDAPDDPRLVNGRPRVAPQSGSGRTRAPLLPALQSRCSPALPPVRPYGPAPDGGRDASVSARRRERTPPSPCAEGSAHRSTPTSSRRSRGHGAPTPPRTERNGRTPAIDP